MKTFFLAVISLWSTQVTCASEYMGKDWINPFDMTRYNHAEKKMINAEAYNSCPKGQGVSKCSDTFERVHLSEEQIHNICGENTESKSEKNMINFLHRFSSILINQFEMEDAEKNGGSISLIMKIEQEQVQDLKVLKNTGNTEEIVRILNTVISHTVPKPPERECNTYFDYFPDFLTSREAWLQIGCFSLAVLPLSLWVYGVTFKKFLGVFFSTGFAVAYILTYNHLLQKYGANRNEKLLKNCAPQNWYGGIFSIFSSTFGYYDHECVKQREAMAVDHTLEVTPLHVISEMFTVVLLHPLEQFGSKFSKFSSEILGSQPFFYGILVYAVAVVILLMVVLLCFTLISGRTIKIGNVATMEKLAVCSQPGVDKSLTETCKRQLSSDTQETREANIPYHNIHRHVVEIITRVEHGVKNSIGEEHGLIDDTKKITYSKQNAQEKCGGIGDSKDFSAGPRKELIVKNEEACSSVQEVSHEFIDSEPHGAANVINPEMKESVNNDKILLDTNN